MYYKKNNVIDTGGIELENAFRTQIKMQAEIAVN